jgi:deoxyribodipyrimidine photolyase
MALPAGRSKLYIKKKLRLDLISFDQRKMFRIATAAVGSVKNRVVSVRNAMDAAAKPLSKSYAIRKTRLLGRNKRDLTYSGSMLQNFQVRTVENNRAFATNSTLRDRRAARANNQRELWIAYSRTNRLVTVRTAQAVLNEITAGMVHTYSV